MKASANKIVEHRPGYGVPALAGGNGSLRAPGNILASMAIREPRRLKPELHTAELTVLELFN